ncbi:MAG: hypothetical protein OEY33_03440 [Bdellovibrionales bacterium]|jgi:hypothetical protein|nr:hypothetical protein [Bdellovibrionales bacterium]
MKKLVLFLSIILAFPLSANQPSSIKILGEFIAPKHNNSLAEKYYFIFNDFKSPHQNVARAFPVSNTDHKTLKYIKKNLGKLFVIQAKTIVKEKNINELPMDVTYLEIQDIHTVELKDIRQKYTVYSNGFKNLSNQYQSKPEKIEFYEIKDSITNKFIFTSAAILIGRALLGF